MNRILSRLVGECLRMSRLELFPVRVRSGFAKGARWTLYPWTYYWRGTHEPGIQRRFEQLGGGDIGGWTCWDIGAHFGLYSIGLALRTGPTGQVASFEPNPLSFRRLEVHRRRNNAPWLKTFQSAASATTGDAELYTYGDLGTTTTHLPYEGETRSNAVKPLSVPTVALDDLVAKGGTPASKVYQIGRRGPRLPSTVGNAAHTRRSSPPHFYGSPQPTGERRRDLDSTTLGIRA